MIRETNHPPAESKMTTEAATASAADLACAIDESLPAELPTSGEAHGNATTRDRDWFGAWRRFWFTPADPLPLAVIRIFTGLIAIYVFAIFGMRLEELFGSEAWLDLETINLIRTEQPTLTPDVHWNSAEPLPLPEAPTSREWVSRYETEWGVDPRQTARQGKAGWSWWYHLTDPAWMPLAHAAYMLVLILFTLGCGTRIVSVLAWVGALAYIHRAPNIQYGLDTFLLIVLMYLMIGPSGAVLSFDRWLARRRARQLGQPEPPVPPSITANIALRLMQIHLCVIYTRSALSKLQGAAWWDGTAVWPTLVSWEFSRIRYGFVAEIVRFICRHRWLWEFVTTSLSVFTIAVELCAPLLIWYRRTRWWALGGLIVLHIGIGALMGLMTFSLISIALSMSFIPASAFHRIGETIRGKEPSRAQVQPAG